MFLINTGRTSGIALLTYGSTARLESTSNLPSSALETTLGPFSHFLAGWTLSVVPGRGGAGGTRRGFAVVRAHLVRLVKGRKRMDESSEEGLGWSINLNY